MVDKTRLDLIERKTAVCINMVRTAIKEGGLDNDPRAQAKHDNSIPYLQSAAQRIRDGVGNICTDCGDEIPEKRLQAVPGAIRCVGCQRQLEDEQRERSRRGA